MFIFIVYFKNIYMFKLFITRLIFQKYITHYFHYKSILHHISKPWSMSITCSYIIEYSQQTQNLPISVIIEPLNRTLLFMSSTTFFIRTHTILPLKYHNSINFNYFQLILIYKTQLYLTTISLWKQVWTLKTFIIYLNKATQQF